MMYEQNAKQRNLEKLVAELEQEQALGDGGACSVVSGQPIPVVGPSVLTGYATYGKKLKER